MGGILGMVIAAKKRCPIKALVLVDIGPFVPASALERLKTYVGKEGYFETIEEYKQYLQKIYAQFGPLTDEQVIINY